MWVDKCFLLSRDAKIRFLASVGSHVASEVKALSEAFSIMSYNNMVSHCKFVFGSADQT